MDTLQMIPEANDWLHESGLNPIDEALARAHQRHAAALVEAIFAAGRGLRGAYAAFERGVAAAFHLHGTA